ncbi:E3 ubiquitin-protein ligase TRIM71-like [Glandiceps talaboti]
MESAKQKKCQGCQEGVVTMKCNCDFSLCDACARTPKKCQGCQEGVVTMKCNCDFSLCDACAHKQKKCQGCQEGVVKVRCIDCVVFLCDACTQTHKILPMTRTHFILTIEEYERAMVENPTSVLSPIYCSSHPDKQVQFYCDPCEQIICLECTVLDHPRPEHRCIYLTDAATNFTEELADIVGKVKEKGKLANNSKTVVQQRTESLNRHYKTELMKISIHIQKIKDEFNNRIDENERMVLKEMTGEYNRRITNLTTQLSGLDGTVNAMTNTIVFAEHLMHYGSAAQMMSARKGMVAQTRQLMRMKTETGPMEDDFMKFHSNDDFYQSKTIGTVQLIPEVFELNDVPKFRRIGEKIHATLTDKHHVKKKQTGSRYKPEIKAEMKTPYRETQDITVRDNKDGTFSLKSLMMIEGDHQVSVSVCKKPVQGSPANVKVIPQKGVVCKFGGYGSGNGQLSRPRGVTMTKSGSMIVGEEWNHRLQLFSLHGKHQRFIQFSDFSSPFTPRYSAVSEDGTIFTTDTGNHQIVVCDENGKLIRCFGTSELFKYPSGIAISLYNGKVYVVDETSHCIRIYSQNGVYIKSFGSKGNKAGQFVDPRGITIESSQGNVYVSYFGSHSIKVYSANGDYLYSFGSKGSGDGQLNGPTGLTTDKHNNVYVCDYWNRRLQKFNSLGKFISVVDCGKDPLSGPVSVCITDEDTVSRIIIVELGINSMRVIMQ